MSTGNIDLNPLNSSLFTGKGLPWGPTQQAEAGDIPGTPQERRLEDFQAFDQSEIVKRLVANLKNEGSKQSLGAMRTAARLGAGKSDAARAAQRDIAAGVEDRAAGVQLAAAKEGWADRMAQKRFAEQMDLQKYQAALQNWQAKKTLQEKEKSDRDTKLRQVFFDPAGFAVK